MEALIAFAFGLLIGSFLNVCIHRWPLDLSVVRPRSRCPKCEGQIAWYDNIPLLSYALLTGRCRHCGVRISPRYPVVELLTGLLFAAVVLHLGLSLEAGKFCLFAALLVGLIFSDLESRILPDEFTLGGLAAGLAIALVVPVGDAGTEGLLWLAGLSGSRLESFLEALLGAGVPSGFLWLGGWVFKKLRHKDGLGLGDVKLMAMVGAFLGLSGSLLTLLTGSLAGSILGLLYIKITGEDAASYELPFGTFLGAAALAMAFLGPRMLNWFG